MELNVGPHHPSLTSTLVALSEVAAAEGEHESARAHAERALAILESAELAPELAAEARLTLAAVIAQSGEHAPRVVEIAQAAHDTLVELGPRTAGQLAEARALLAAHDASRARER